MLLLFGGGQTPRACARPRGLPRHRHKHIARLGVPRVPPARTGRTHETLTPVQRSGLGQLAGSERDASACGRRGERCCGLWPRRRWGGGGGRVGVAPPWLAWLAGKHD